MGSEIVTPWEEATVLISSERIFHGLYKLFLRRSNCYIHADSEATSFTHLYNSFISDTDIHTGEKKKHHLYYHKQMTFKLYQ